MGHWVQQPVGCNFQGATLENSEDAVAETELIDRSYTTRISCIISYECKIITWQEIQKYVDHFDG